MKQITCPRCNGSGVVEEDGTLIGLSPFQERPSTVNDDEWVAPEQGGERTRIQSVPSFKAPKTTGAPIPSPRPPPDNTRFAHDSERPTALIHSRAELLPRPPRWPWLLVAIAGAGWLGFVAGTGLLASWFTFAKHVVRSRLGW